jgi:CRP-like cAMP-binding protein
MSVPSEQTGPPLGAAAETPRQQMRMLLAHVGRRIALLDRLEQQRTQIVIIIGALIQALNDTQKVPDAALEQLLARTGDAASVRLILEPFLASSVTADQRAFQDFIDLFTAALMLERSSFAAGAARQQRYDAEPAEIAAVAQLGPMVEQAARLDRYSGRKQEDLAAVSFWETLDAHEQEALMAVASRRRVEAGAILMEEGDKADYVIVILNGWTKICIQAHGSERVVAKRGPGQLVGEHGALQINVRSASVVALEAVEALAVRTEDFAAFTRAHPTVLDIMERQTYARLIEAPPISEHDDDTADALSDTAGERNPAGRPSGHRPYQPQPLDNGNCTVLITDVVGFGARSRDDQDRRAIREATWNMTRKALEPWWDVSSKEDRGDGLLLVVPPGIPTAEILERLSSELPVSLTQHNAVSTPSARIQLRVAVSAGPVSRDTIGMTGEAIILAARMLEAPAFKKAMSTSRANLGVIASSSVREAAIRQRGDLTGFSGFAQVKVSLKGSRFPAWMRLADSPAD